MKVQLMSTMGLAPEQLEHLLAVARALISDRDPEAVLDRVLAAARELTGARYAALGILDERKRGLSRFLYAGIDEATRRRIGPLPRGQGILGELIRTPRPLRISKISEHPRSYGFPAEHPPMNTFLGVPVKIDDEVYGNLYLTEKENGEDFDDQDEQLLVLVAEWAAIAVDNARSHEDTQGRRAELEVAMRGLEATVSLNREVGGETELARVLELAGKRARALVEARSCVIFLVEDDATLTIAEVVGEAGHENVGERVPMSTSGAADVLRAGQSHRSTAAGGRRFEELGVEATSILLVPLRSRGVDIGVIAAFDHLGARNEFSADDTLALESFATSAASAIAATKTIEGEMRRLSIGSSERERQRWARELHDETLQELGALNVMQESALQANDAAIMRSALIHAKEQVETIITGLQGLITDLRPAALDQLGTAAALEALAERVTSRSGLVIDLDIDLAYEGGRETTRPTPELEATLYRTVQEALTNVVKHAQANRARVRVEERDSTATVTVEDDGKGFSEDSAHDGYGLLGMSERIALAGGELTIEPAADGGTRVSALVPVVRATESGSAATT